ncbi:MAG: hypothetical protein RMK97_00645 [Sutterellaceae bacterium]|nr:hypothetical protein [Burkholderiaceae bacterium]MDW8429008.1 hypothetical protein [Sutterellaceae bacterium]
MGGVFLLGIAVAVVGGLWSLILSMGIVYGKLGLFWTLVGVLFFPVTFLVAPWYAALAEGNWQPLLIGYGSAIAGGLLSAIGARRIDGPR